MTIPWGQIGLLAVEALLVAGLLLFLFSRRGRIGLAPLYLAVGCLQPLQVLLAASVYIEVWPGILLSPGSAVLFPATLFAVLLTYVREDATEARKLIYGILITNVVVSGVLFISALQVGGESVTAVIAVPQALFFQNFRIMAVGTIVLFLDALLIIAVFEGTSRWLARSLFVHLVVSFALVLAFDTLAFSVGAFLGEVPMSGFLISGLVAKTFFALVYSAPLAFYLNRQAMADSEHADGAFAPGKAKRRRLDPFSGYSFRQRYKAALERSMRDPLTGLHNRGFFDETLIVSLEQCRRSKSQLTVMMIDLEGFKKINDTHGHLAGDQVLRHFADLLRSSARAEDVVCRYGGDEFAVIIRQPAGGEAGAALGERLASEIRRIREVPGSPGLSMPGLTGGIATYPADGETAEELVRTADAKLYQQRRALRAN